MDPLSTFVLSVVLAAAGFAALYFVVRAAVLDALRVHRAEVAASDAPSTESYLDADGL